MHELLAWGVAHLMNATGHFKNNPVTMGSLMGPAWLKRHMPPTAKAPKRR